MVIAVSTEMGAMKTIPSIHLDQRITLEKRIVKEVTKGIHHETFEIIGTLWANMAFKRSHHISGHADQFGLYRFVVRKSDRLKNCRLGRLRWNGKNFLIKAVFANVQHPGYIIGYCTPEM